MPELPEVETIARQLGAALAGRVLGKVVHLRPDMVRGADRPLRRGLPGRRVTRVHRRAKRIVFELTEGRRHKGTKAQREQTLQLVVHLGMTGRLTVCNTDEPTEKHTHLRIAIQDSTKELRFRDPRRFGGIWLLSIVDCQMSIGSEATKRRSDGATECKSKRQDRKGFNRESTIDNQSLTRRVKDRSSGRSQDRQIIRSRIRELGSLGPEPLDVTPAGFRRVIQRKRQIKALLLDQTAIAGLGNIYCDESLHAAGIHPLAQAAELSPEQARRLLRAIKSVLRRAIRFNGSTFMDYRSVDGEPGSFQRFHRVYGREGLPCRRCRTPIVRIVVAGRSSFFCCECQPQRTPRRS